MNAYLIVSSFVVAVITLFFLVSVFLRGFSQARNLTFCLFAVSVFVWILGYMYWQMASSEADAIFWVRILVIGSSFIPYTYLHFVTKVTNTRAEKLIFCGYGVAVLLLSLAFTPYIFKGVESRLGFPYWPVAGPAFALYFGGFVVVVVYCYFLLIRQYRSSPAKVKNQNKYLIIGTAVGFLGGATNFPLWMDVQVPPWGHGLSIFYILGIGYSVLKYRLLDFNEMAVRLLGLIITAVVFGGILAAGLVVVLNYSYPDFYPRAFSFWWIAITVQSFLFLLFGPSLFTFLNDLIQAGLISTRFAYRDNLKALSDEIISEGNEDEFVEVVVKRISGAMGLDVSSIYLRSDLESGFVCKASEGSRPLDALIEAEKFEPIVKILRGQRHAVFLEEEMEKSLAFRRDIGALLTEGATFRSSDVFVPIAAGESFYGFLILGSSRQSKAFADVDLILLENLCAQMGLALKMREMERVSSQVEKLVSLGTMAAGLSHELRNPLVSIRTLTGLLQKNPENLSLNREFSETVQRDVKRITGIVEGVSAFAKDARRPLNLVDVRAILDEVEYAMVRKLEEKNVRLEVQFDKGVPPAVGNFEQLIQVFQNIIENAINAIAEWEHRPEEGRIHVRVRCRGGSRVEVKQWVEVEISDNGPGIAPEFQARIFDPFVTSRDTGLRHGGAGTGLGLAITNKIIELHRGMITVKSEIGGGAQFRISIPCE